MHIVAITGASGAILGIRLIEELLNAGEEVAAIASTQGKKIIEHEVLAGAACTSLTEVLSGRAVARDLARLAEYGDDDLFAPCASGTARFESVTVIPSSMKTLAAVAAGHAGTLITRACDVALKERRRCVLVTRELHALDIADSVEPGGQRPRGGHAGVELAQRSCRRIPGIREGRFPGRYTLLVELRESLQR